MFSFKTLREGGSFKIKFFRGGGPQNFQFFKQGRRKDISLEILRALYLLYNKRRCVRLRGESIVEM